MRETHANITPVHTDEGVRYVFCHGRFEFEALFEGSSTTPRFIPLDSQLKRLWIEQNSTIE